MDDPTFEREMYLSFADEFDAHGREAKDLVFDANEWDALSLRAAKRYAERHGLPLPWTLQSMDNALLLVTAAEEGTLV